MKSLTCDGIGLGLEGAGLGLGLVATGLDYNTASIVHTTTSRVVVAVWVVRMAV